MADHAAAAHPGGHTLELGSLAGRYSTTDDALPWWASASFFASGVLIWLVLGMDGWVYYLGYILFFVGILGLGQRVLRATTEIAPTGLRLKGHYGRRTQVTWTDVADVLPARFSSGRSRVRLVDGRRVLLGGVPAVRARRLREVLNRSAPGLRTE